MRNNSDTFIVIPRHAYLGIVIELKEEGCYTADIEDYKLTSWKSNIIIKIGGAFKIICLPNSITIYSLEGSSKVLVLTKVYKGFLKVWSKAIGTINIPSIE